MNRQRHEEELLGPYVLGVLDPEEIRRVEEHTSGCVQCREEVAALREMEAALGEVPDEAFLDGPPHGGDLLLQRTLRQMRGERAGDSRRRAGLAGLAVAASLAAVFWAGTQLGTGDPDAVALPVPPSPTATANPSPPPAGTKVLSATDKATGARMTVRMTPATKWVRVHAAVTGVPPGERCRADRGLQERYAHHRHAAGSRAARRTARPRARRWTVRRPWTRRTSRRSWSRTSRAGRSCPYRSDRTGVTGARAGT